MSLRWKISLLIVASVIIAVLSCSIILRQSAARAEDDRMRATVTEQLSNAVTIFSETGVLTLNARIDDPELPAEARASALKGQSVTIRSEVDGEEIVWAAAPIEVGTYTEVISVRASTADSQELIGRIDQALLVGMIGSALVVGGVGSLVAGRISRRLTLGAQAARKIAAGDTSIRIADVVDESDQEVAAFASAVDTAVSRLTERIDSEQRFTADLAHEMRTPLTGLVNAANLLQEDSRPAELVKDRVRRMQVLVEDLLEVSRLDAGRANPEFTRVDIDQSIRSLLGTMTASGALAGHEIDTDLGADGATLVTDARRFERIVSNLLVNAIKHGADPIRLETTGRGLVVTDSGPGYPPDIVAAGPTRFVSAGGGGMGLGLVIAQGQARLLGIRLVFANDPDTGGARTEVLFPEAEAQDRMLREYLESA
ncbi:signal transduction histidine kinase [Brevibacterium sanguinis]|uniref:histidine kinase n=2 Tax=Brevibacterium TaxID=1696 RepID=A0A366ILQ8_9MICO|nr:MULTISPECIES: histidine kinase dimerization/phospho-acceptor domain-containing protein [Brevibacterium]RBP67136.1 signal transduction histidine kinase [Brevibacterium sanguinis]RBP73661.1 signal transduction histidine kinase [Brevibacterium celere]